MNPDDLVVSALGVLLTQVRTARRALEDVQRATSRYMGFEFAKALAEGPRFGSPPMFQGALMVHVVNINDLAPGNSFGGFLEALLGGVGNFFSNLIGGAAGGFLTSLRLPKMLERLERITENVLKIVQRLGIGAAKAPATMTTDTADPGSAKAKPAEDESLATTLAGLKDTFKLLTAMFTAAQGGPAAANAAGQTSSMPLTASGERWMAILDGINRLLDRTKYVVDALNFAIPQVIGGIALLITNLGVIRTALLETIQFLLRSALVLRGVILTVIFETVAAAARLVASIMTILGTTIQGMLTTILGVVHALIGAAFDALGALTGALQTVVRELLQWLVTGVFDVLRTLGTMSVFRTIDHLIRSLPALLPPIFMLMNKGQSFPADVMQNLQTAHDAGFASNAAGTTGTAGPAAASLVIGTFPDIQKLVQPLRETLTTAVDKTATHLQDATAKTFGDAEGALGGLAGRFEKAVGTEADRTRGVLDKRLPTIRANADAVADAITRPIEKTSAATPQLEGIASAYEGWLTQGGLSSLFGIFKEHLKNAPTSGEPGGALGLRRGQFDAPRASIEIDRVEIVLEPLPTIQQESDATTDAPTHGGTTQVMSDEEIFYAVMRYGVDQDARGRSWGDPQGMLAS